MYGEEVDLCHRARARGWRPIVTPEATIMHLGGASRSSPAAEAHPGRPRARQRRRAALAAALAALGTGDALALGGEPLRREPRCSRAAGGPRTLWSEVWARRRDWLRGWRPEAGLNQGSGPALRRPGRQLQSMKSAAV